jgi:hypothetical protein
LWIKIGPRLARVTSRACSRALAGAVTKFRDALVEFLELHVTNEVARGLAPAVVPRDDADPAEIQRRRTEVAKAAGLAADGYP